MHDQDSRRVRGCMGSMPASGDQTVGLADQHAVGGGGGAGRGSAHVHPGLRRLDSQVGAQE